MVLAVEQGLNVVAAEGGHCAAAFGLFMRVLDTLNLTSEEYAQRLNDDPPDLACHMRAVADALEEGETT